MSYKGRMEPGAYEGLCKEYQHRINIAAEKTQLAARNDSLEAVRYQAGIQDGLRMALLILEGRNS